MEVELPTAELDGVDAFQELVRLAVNVDPQLASPPSAAAASTGAARSFTGDGCSLSRPVMSSSTDCSAHLCLVYTILPAQSKTVFIWIAFCLSEVQH